MVRSKSARPSRGNNTVVPSAPRTLSPASASGARGFDGVERAGQVRREHREVVVGLRHGEPSEGSLVRRGPLGQERGLAGPHRTRDEDDRRSGAELIDQRGAGDEAGPDLRDPELGVEGCERAQGLIRACEMPTLSEAM